MDSVTQITLGAAVGEAVLGRQLGNRAIAWGAIFGTLPDLDVVATPWLDSVEFMVHHRALSHSFFATAIASPLLAAILTRWYRTYPEHVSYRRWLAFFVLVFVTHILLDCCTNYGTQIWAPFSDVRVAWNNIFIIDPLYTLPFLTCVVTCLFLERDGRWRRRLNFLGLLLSTGYLALTFANKTHVNGVFARALADQQIETQRFMTCPTPLNNLLWYGVAESETGYHVGFYSLLDSNAELEFEFIPRRAELLGDLRDTYDVDRLIWFANGYYNVRSHHEGLLLHVMNFGKLTFAGERELYPFTYLLRQTPNPGLEVKRFASPREESLGDLLSRLWTRMKGI